MYGREEVELFLLGREDGMTIREAAALAGATYRSGRNWAAGILPRSYTGAPARGRMGAATRPKGAVPVAKRGVYDPPASGPLAGLAPAQIENLLLRAVLADLKAGGWDPASISNGSKCELGERLRRETGLPLRSITGFLRISRSSYEYHRARLGRDRDAALRPLVERAFRACGERGYRAVWAELRASGVRASEKRVRRVMREEGLVCRRLRRARRWSSYAGEPSPAPPNLPLRADGTHDFTAPAPNLLWATDITEFRLPSGGKAYLSPVVDLFDGRPVAWSVGPRPTAALANSSLEAACATLAPGERPVVHSDRGGHYRWPGWAAVCESRGLVRSMSRKGRSPDNARMEGFFGTLKSERWDPREWEGRTRGELIGAIGSWMEWFRSGRRSQALGWRTPDEHRRAAGYPV